MARKIRPARMAAVYVESGDVLVSAPADSKVIGTVLRVRSGATGVNFLVRTPGGSVVEYPDKGKTILPERPVWVHVPRSAS